LNFVKVHDADDLFGFVLNFLVAMSHKLGEDHAAACQELIHCFCLFHVFPFGLLRDRHATTFAVGLPTICPLLSPFPLDGRAEQQQD
jgi:hypothetical protein